MEGDNNNQRQGALMPESVCCHGTDDNEQSDGSSLPDCSKLSANTGGGGGGVTGFSHSAGPRRGLVHSVSIIVEPANTMEDSDLDDQIQISPTVPMERRKTIAGPIVVMEDFYFDQPKKGKEYDDIVQSLFASARVRKEEFARLLEEHAQIVNEINKAETSLS